MAVMDFSPSGWVAEFDPSESTDHVVWRLVERWSGDGDAPEHVAMIWAPAWKGEREP